MPNTNKNITLLTQNDIPEGEKYPLLIWLHGGGGKAESNGSRWPKSRPLPYITDPEKAKFKVAVLYPQTIEPSAWVGEEVGVLVRYLLEEYPFDPNRVYLTGHSMGGAGIWLVANRNPDLFAALVPCMGGGRIREEVIDVISFEKLKNIPVWAFNGGKDKVTPVEYSIEIDRVLNSIGGDSKITIYPEMGHNGPSPAAFAQEETYTWLLSHTKSSVTTEANQPPRPNVLFILTDDQSYSTMSCTGSSFMNTPNLDRLARDGALFRNLIVATSVCAPSRAAFMTGTYNWVNGVFANAAKWDPKNVILAQMMQKAGYATAHIGKWHCGDLKDPQPGYDHWFVAPGQGRYEDPIININGRNRTFQGEYLTTLTTDEMIKFINQDHGGKPFLVWYAMKAVHGGRAPEEKYMDRFKDLGVRQLYGDKVADLVKITRNPDGTVKPADQLPKGVEDPFGGKPLEGPEGALEYERHYYRLLLSVEDSMGRIFDALKNNGILDNTLIIFTCDNGYFHGEGGKTAGKRVPYEPAIRVPMMVHYPRQVKTGQKIDRIVSNVDLVPTVLDFCGITIPKQVQGISWKPLVTGNPDAPWREAFVYTMPGRQNSAAVALRTEHDKLILSPPNTEEYYILANDPWEEHNLAADHKYKVRIDEMKKQLLEEMVKIDHPGIEMYKKWPLPDRPLRVPPGSNGT